jgi:hypothetical protein
VGARITIGARSAVQLKNGYAFAKGKHYAQQHIVADLSASDSPTNHIKGFCPNFVRINCSFELFD